MKRGWTVPEAIVAAAIGLASVPAFAAAQDPNQHKASVSVHVSGLHGGRVEIGDRVTITANLRPYQVGEKLKVLLIHDGKVVERRALHVKPNHKKTAGSVSLDSHKLDHAGRYVARVIHYENPTLTKARVSSSPFKLSYPNLSNGSRGPAVAAFNNLLREQGYGEASGGDTIGVATQRAVQAFRTVNGMSRSYDVNTKILKKLAKGNGAFPLRYPNAGKHVEVDISRQAMVLADHGKPKFTYHISSGAPGNPSPRGQFNFYWKDPGYNSLGMYYSAYFVGGYATHGYHDVPPYPASHGCIRNPIPESRFIYNWIDIGDPIWLYD